MGVGNRVNKKNENRVSIKLKIIIVLLTLNTTLKFKNLFDTYDSDIIRCSYTCLFFDNKLFVLPSLINFLKYL